MKPFSCAAVSCKLNHQHVKNSLRGHKSSFKFNDKSRILQLVIFTWFFCIPKYKPQIILHTQISNYLHF